MTDQRESETAKPKISRVEVYWTTISYRTLVIYAALALGIVLAIFYLLFPESFASVLRRASDTLGGRSVGVAIPKANQARFVNLDGKVQVKKVNSVQWVNADYRMTLDKGDLIQTGSDGVARITFADSTIYTVKADTLITVEENSLGQDRSSRVGVHISSGAVDLSTATWEVPSSKVEVSFENAVASLQQNSRAAVRSDPSKNQHEITVAAGGAELVRGGEQIQIGQWEKVSFPTGGQISKTRVLAPPDLARPMNLQPIIVPDPQRAPVRFEWKAVPGAVGYHLRVGTSAMFTHVVAERRVVGN
jgi:hypothetical protein